MDGNTRIRLKEHISINNKIAGTLGGKSSLALRSIIAIVILGSATLLTTPAHAAEPTAAPTASSANAKPDCIYCSKEKRLTQLMIEVGELPNSTVYLFRNQFFAGRCVVAFKGHKRELYELTPAERAGFMDDVARVAGALNQLFHPDKINYAIFGDEVSHLHFHVVPKYRSNSEWGRPFPMNPDAKKR